MLTSKVYLTYKIKLQLSRSSITHENGCHVASSGGSSDKPVAVPCDEYKSENQQRSSLIFPGCVNCGVRGNLLQCKDCHQPYHYECLDRPFKSRHILNREMEICGCKLRDASTVQPIQTSIKLEAGEDIEESDVKQLSLSSCESSGTGCYGEDTSIKGTEALPHVDACLKSNSFHGEVHSCSVIDVDSEEKLEILDSIGSKHSVERNCISDSLSSDKTAKQSTDFLKQTKLTTSLITFSRRGKRKKNDDMADVKSSLPMEKNCSFLTSQIAVGLAPLKVSVGDNATNMELSMEGRDSRPTCQQNQENKEDDSICLHIESAVDLKCEEELSLGSKSTSKDASLIGRQGPIFRAAMDAEEALLDNCSQISINDVAKDPSEVIVTDGELENAKHQDIFVDLSADVVPDHVKEETRPCLNLSVTSDSCGKLECDINLDLGCQKEPVIATFGSLRDSMNSISRSHATISDQASPAGLFEDTDERIREGSLVQVTRALSEASCCAEDPGFNLNDEVGACPISTFTESKHKCLQLFSEEKGNCFNPRTMEESESLNLGSNTDQMSGSPLDLDLSLPTGSNTGDYFFNKRTHASLISNSNCRIQDFVREAMPQSTSSLLRHKLMLDSIVSRASALNVKSGFQDKFKSYTTPWLEEELDSLWIGVRRHGRDNWHAMLRDPRLHFSSWRTARDLAEQWVEEQAKLLNGTHNNGGFLCPKTRIWKENCSEETRLSLGDVYARRTRGSYPKRWRCNFACLETDTELFHKPTSYPRTVPYLDFLGMDVPICDPLLINSPFLGFPSKGNLPHWLREVVNTPLMRPMEATPPPRLSSIVHSGTMQVSKPYPDPTELYEFSRIDAEFGSARVSDVPPYGSVRHSGVLVGTRHGKAETGSGFVDKPENLMIIDSDASSEETISDDHSARA